VLATKRLEGKDYATMAPGAGPNAGFYAPTARRSRKGEEMRIYVAGWFVILLAGCSSVRTFDMRWELTSTGKCKGPGLDPSYAAQQEITLRYDTAPNHYVVACSNKLAATLKAAKGTTVPMVQRRNGGKGSSTSICAIAGIKDDAPGTSCTFAGTIGGGYENNPEPNPWD
jgi:hypothetical protein